MSLLHVIFIAVAIGLRLVFPNSPDTLVRYAVFCKRVTNLRGSFPVCCPPRVRVSVQQSGCILEIL